MNQTNQQIIDQNMNQFNQQQNNPNINPPNDNSTELPKSYTYLVLLAGVLTLVPKMLLMEVLESINANLVKGDVTFLFLQVINFIGLSIYLFLPKKTIQKDPLPKITMITLVATILIYFFLNSLPGKTFTGFILVTVGTALIYIISLLAYYGLAFTTFMYYLKDIKIRKEIKTVIIIIIVAISSFLFYAPYLSIRKVPENIPTVADFKNELTKRNLYVDENLLFGVDNNENNLHQINFSKNSNEKYPSYVYYGYKTQNNNSNDYSYWIIYYTNGKLHAALAKHLSRLDSDKIDEIFDIYTIYSDILSEDEKVYTYNCQKNYYEKINIKKGGVDSQILHDNNIDVLVLENPEKGYVERIHKKYKVINKIDSNSLDDYAKNNK